MLRAALLVGLALLLAGCLGQGAPAPAADPPDEEDTEPTDEQDNRTVPDDEPTDPAPGDDNDTAPPEDPQPDGPVPYVETHRAWANVTGAAGIVETGPATLDPSVADGASVRRSFGVDEGVTAIHVNVTWDATIPDASRLEVLVTNDRLGDREATTNRSVEVRLDSGQLSAGRVEVQARRTLVDEDAGWLGVAAREPVKITVHVLYHGATLPVTASG